MDAFFSPDEQQHLADNYPTLHQQLTKDPDPTKVALAHALLKAALKQRQPGTTMSVTTNSQGTPANIEDLSLPDLLNGGSGAPSATPPAGSAPNGASLPARLLRAAIARKS